MERLISYRLISQGKSEEVKVNCKYYDGCYDLPKFDFIPRGRKVNNQRNFCIILKYLCNCYVRNFITNCLVNRA